MMLPRNTRGIAPILFVMVAFVVIGAGVAAWYFLKPESVYTPPPDSYYSTPQASNSGTLAVATTPQAIPQADIILQNVPFTVQAPFGDWKNPKLQDACEEASSLMAMWWVKGQEKLSPEEAKTELLKIADYQHNIFGDSRDTSIHDTAKRILEGYFHFTNYEIKSVTSVSDMVHELERGNILIVAVNGQALGQRNFTQPGPERHMFVIKGYDRKKHQFITNETGIRQGESWRYDENIVFNALRDYETGYHVPITRNDKLMIVIHKT